MNAESTYSIFIYYGVQKYANDKVRNSQISENLSSPIKRQ
jgi:hypothetical protein